MQSHPCHRQGRHLDPDRPHQVQAACALGDSGSGYPVSTLNFSFSFLGLHDHLSIYQPPIENDDEAAAEHARLLSDSIPFSIIGSTEDVKTPDGRVVKGREYLWGVAEGRASPSSLDSD